MPEETAVAIFYSSIYGNTENAVQILAAELGKSGLRNIKMYDVSKTHFSYIISESFRASHLVFASITYNAGIFVNMENVLHSLAEHNLQNRTIALIDNGSWAAQANRQMKAILGELKNITFIPKEVSIKSAIKEAELNDIKELSSAILESMPKPKLAAHVIKENSIDNETFFKLSYGLYLLTARDGNKDNGCVINTMVQLTDSPKRITIAVNKQNYTHDMILKTGVFNVSVFSENVTFKTIQRFGFQSGRTTDKYEGLTAVCRSANGITYDGAESNSFVSGKVVSHTDFGTHTLFVADVTEAGVLNGKPSVTYQYYFDHIKPKPPVGGGAKKGWVCKICGYVHEEDDLPDDFICPLCKHGVADFERL
jgi:flavin reductase (DIM6/NTAB) family NADH-FMN oxidoreductase RutF/flavodoxin